MKLLARHSFEAITLAHYCRFGFFALPILQDNPKSGIWCVQWWEESNLCFRQQSSRKNNIRLAYHINSRHFVASARVSARTEEIGHAQKMAPAGKFISYRFAKDPPLSSETKFSWICGGEPYAKAMALLSGYIKNFEHRHATKSIV